MKGGHILIPWWACGKSREMVLRRKQGWRQVTEREAAVGGPPLGDGERSEPQEQRERRLTGCCWPSDVGLWDLG